MTGSEFLRRYRATETDIQAYVEGLPSWVNARRSWMPGEGPSDSVRRRRSHRCLGNRSNAPPGVRQVSLGIRRPFWCVSVRDGVWRLVYDRLDRLARVGVRKSAREAICRCAHRARDLRLATHRGDRRAFRAPSGVANVANVGPADGPARTVRRGLS